MFFQKAYEGRNRWWRWLLTIAGLLLVFILAQIPLIVWISQEAGRLGLSEDAILNGALPAGLDRNILLLLFMIPFVAGFAAFWFFINQLHGKSLLSVMTGRAHFDWRRAFVGFGIWFALLCIAIFAVLPADSYVYQFNASTFWPLLLIALLLIPIQTTLEEIFFRGYLMQGVFLLARNKLAPLLVIVAVFTLVHSSNPEFYNDYASGIAEYFLMSLLLGLVAVLDDGLELTCGIHAANNIFLTAVMSTSGGSLQTYALFETSLKAFADHVLLLSIVPYVIGFTVLFLAFRWRFSTLFEKVRRSRVGIES